VYDAALPAGAHSRAPCRASAAFYRFEEIVTAWTSDTAAATELGPRGYDACRSGAWRGARAMGAGQAASSSVLGFSRKLVIVGSDDRSPRRVGPKVPRTCRRGCSAERLKQALEAAAGPGRTAERAPARRTREHGPSSSQGRNEREETAGEGDWRGSRSFLRGGSDQAIATVRSLSREMDRLWEQVMRRAANAGRGTGGFMGSFMPAIEMCEQGDEVRICAEVPGIEAADLHVEVDGGCSSCAANGVPTSQSVALERIYGSFVRRIPLPECCALRMRVQSAARRARCAN